MKMDRRRWKALRKLAGFRTQDEAGAAVAVGASTISSREQTHSHVHYKWLLAEAALREGVCKGEIIRRVEEGGD